MYVYIYIRSSSGDEGMGAGDVSIYVCEFQYISRCIDKSLYFVISIHVRVRMHMLVHTQTTYMNGQGQTATAQWESDIFDQQWMDLQVRKSSGGRNRKRISFIAGHYMGEQEGGGAK